MDKNIEKFLKNLKFSDGEIKNLVSICPMLDELDLETAQSNIMTVTNFGYPADDITFLISVNPTFLCRNTADLAADLNNILKTGADLEVILKNDPNII